MREAEIRLMQQRNAARSALMLNQFSFLETRGRAMESVLSNSPIWKRLWWILSPVGIWKEVDALQLRLMTEEKAKMAAAVEKAKEDARKPRLTIVGANGAVHA